MLDADTKRRIDSLRDILVGKVPDPKSQVEQITIALIYKFMDDMDAQAEALGGKRSFFVNGFERFSWPKLLAPQMGGQDTINLYGEAIGQMTQNTHLPPLFRDIFKNAYLPYRDPETLRSFLKEIDAFRYDHSEKLGDAFEYLLSVLGSQGDAGQFRTPRHLIDFIVSVVNPQKHERLLDPACGTAGFLISAWKHILAQNGKARPGDQLTAKERDKLASSLVGYDISPDMVRLSLVNLYLHGFPNPCVDEYDTLTSDDRWNEHFDVILANPPFMSPKGGIKPHKRFSIPAKRSEVLFVDYIAEHLTPTGRAGIIVPEGIIFQSQTAYKALRKMLVNQSLIAVISLPAGCFNPYSGVKTSILILDKALAKHADSIAFFKVESDGFDLGAQRRPLPHSDLPRVKQELDEYLSALRQQQSVSELVPTCGLIVSKEKLAANGEFNLSGERYREGAVTSHSFPLVRIADVCAVNPRKSQLADRESGTRISFVPMADLGEHKIAFEPKEDKLLSEVAASYTYFENNDVLLAKVTPCFENGKAGIARNLLNGIGFGSSEFYVLRSNGQALPEWIYFCVMHPLFRDAAVAQMTGTGGLQRVPRDYVENFQIPLPPLEVQKEIVAEIEGYQKVIDGARAVVDNYRPHILIHPDWPAVPLGNVIKLASGRGLTQSQMIAGPYPVYGGNGQNGTHSEYFLDAPNVAIGRVGAYCGAVHLTEANAWVSDNALYVTEYKQDIDRKYLAQALVQVGLNRYAKVGGQPSISQTTVYERSIPLPPLATQQAIVAEIEAEQALVNANRELITRFEKKIQATLARVWGE